MRIGRTAVAVPLAVCALVTSSAGPAAAGGYCRTNVDNVAVHAEPRGDSPVTRRIPKAGTWIICSTTSVEEPWWRAQDEHGKEWAGFVEKRLADSHSG